MHVFILRVLIEQTHNPHVFHSSKQYVKKLLRESLAKMMNFFNLKIFFDQLSRFLDSSKPLDNIPENDLWPKSHYFASSLGKDDLGRREDQCWGWNWSTNFLRHKIVAGSMVRQLPGVRSSSKYICIYSTYKTRDTWGNFVCHDPGSRPFLTTPSLSSMLCLSIYVCVWVWKKKRKRDKISGV